MTPDQALLALMLIVAILLAAIVIVL